MTLNTKIGTMHPTSIDLPADSRREMVDLCNQQLANIFDLYSQTKQAHWNVKGIYFEQLHVLFDKMADGIFDFGDMIAERATALGGTALGTVQMAAGATEFPDFPADVFDGKEMLKIVVARWAQYAAGVRAAIHQADEAGDLSTSDMFTEISREVDKLLWFAEAHLQG
ncbi:MAG: DNA starvation/stationary phase protection protein Dps [Ardenticatenaceae bacterium]|nr:DNA starvation/stationary phase protection protein Dps [Ardenticatenaceae bacterium]